MRQLKTSLLYGTSEAGISAVETFLRLHLLIFYSQTVQLPAFWVAAAIAISLLWNAAIDPLIGRFSDEFKRQKGTRMHLVLAGAITSSLLLVALFNPPIFSVGKTAWLYLLFICLAFHSAFSLFAIPYTAMVGDFSSDRQLRTQMIAWRTLFANAGIVIGVWIPSMYVMTGRPDAYTNATWIFVMLVLISGFLTSLGPPQQQKINLEAANQNRNPLRSALSNGHFLKPLGAFFLSTLGLFLATSMAIYFYRLKAGISEKEIQNVLLLFFFVSSLSLPFWLFCARKWGTKKSLSRGLLGFGLLSSIVFPFLPEKQILPIYLIASVIGGILLGCTFLLDVTVTDIVDEDFRKTNHEKFGLYFGIWRFVSRFSRLLAFVLAGLFLEWANVSFPDIDTSFRLGLVFGPGVGGLFIVAGLLIFAYPLSLEQRSHG